MNASVKLYVGKNAVDYKYLNRTNALRAIDNIKCHLPIDSEINYGVSYAKNYYAVIVSAYYKVSVDIEKECNSAVIFDENVRYMQDRKLWVIKECAAKYCGMGISVILKGTKLQLVSKIKKYELWRVSLDDIWGVDDVYVIYRFLGNKLHLTFSMSDYFKGNLNKGELNEIII